jgi:hypothetical protein
MGQSTTPVIEPAELLGTISSDEPHPLPCSAYPEAKDVAQHGVQALPPSLPFVDFGRAQPHRSSRYTTIVAADLTRSQCCRWRGWLPARSPAANRSPATSGRPSIRPRGS